MADIKLIREAFSTDEVRLTLNDVACAVLSKAMGLAASQRSVNGLPKDKRIPVMVPISLRAAGDYSLSNLTTGAIAWFPMDVDMPLGKRLQQVHREMDVIKRSWWPRLWYNAVDLLGRRRILFLPSYPLMHEFFEKAYREYQIATNVPGPPKPVKFGEHTAHRYFVLPPSSPGKATLSIGMISYAGEFSVAVACDDVPEQAELCETICNAFHEAANDLVIAAKHELAARVSDQAEKAYGTAHVRA